MFEFKECKRRGSIELRPYIIGEDLTGISVSKVDSPEIDNGFIARNPNNHDDQWYVARQYAIDNYEVPIDWR